MTDTVFYNEMAELAEELLTDFGFASTITGGTQAGYVDDNQNYIPPSITTLDCLITPTLDYKTSEIDGTVIQTGDCYVFVDMADSPEIDMTTDLNGVTWRIVSVGGMATPAGQVLYRELQLRS